MNATHKTIVRTCFTLAATSIVKAPAFLLAVKLTTFKPNATAPLNRIVVHTFLSRTPVTNVASYIWVISPVRMENTRH